MRGAPGAGRGCPCADVLDPLGVGGHAGRALRELHQHGTQKRRGDPHQSRDLRVGSHRPDVSQGLRPVAADGRRIRLLRQEPARGSSTLDDAGRAHESAIRRGHRAARRDGADRSGDLREGPNGRTTSRRSTSPRSSVWMPHSRTSCRRSNLAPEKLDLITHNSSVQDS